MPVPLNELERHQARQISRMVKGKQEKNESSLTKRAGRFVDNIITPVHKKVSLGSKKEG